MPDAKTAGFDLARIAGEDRWHTARIVRTLVSTNSCSLLLRRGLHESGDLLAGIGAAAV